MSPRRLLVAYLPLLALACQDPLAPAEGTAGPELAAAALVERGTGVLRGTGVITDPCLGESLRVTVNIPYVWHTTVTPTGNVVYHDRFLSQEATGSAIGLTSGTKWEIVRNVSPFVQISGPAGTTAVSTAHQLFVSEDGDRMVRHVLYYIQIHNDGALVLERIEEDLKSC